MCWTLYLINSGNILLVKQICEHFLIIHKILRICIKKEDTVLSDIFYVFMAERGGFEPPHGRPV